MTKDEIRTALLGMIGNVGNEPAGTPIGRFVRGEDVPVADLARDLGRTDGCEDLAAAARALPA